MCSFQRAYIGIYWGFANREHKHVAPRADTNINNWLVNCCESAWNSNSSSPSSASSSSPHISLNNQPLRHTFQMLKKYAAHRTQLKHQHSFYKFIPSELNSKGGNFNSQPIYGYGGYAVHDMRSTHTHEYRQAHTKILWKMSRGIYHNALCVV